MKLNIIVQKNQCGNWVAFCKEMTSMWSEATTIEDAVQIFKSEYGAMAEMFNEEITMDFSIKGT